MDSASENESDFEVVFDESETDDDDDDDDVPVVDRLWTNVRYVENFEYPHEINPFSRHMGPVNPPVNDAPPVDYFHKLTVPDEGRNLIEILVEETNRYANQFLSNPQYNPKPFSRTLKWHDTNVEEMSAYLGLYLSMGIVRKPSIEAYWQGSEQSYLFRTPGFAEVMTRDRFQILSKFLHCNNNLTQMPRGDENYDPSHKFRPILDLLNETFPKAYDLARDLTIDESMVGFKVYTHINTIPVYQWQNIHVKFTKYTI